MSWQVLLTEPNREFSATKHLNFLSCETFLPVFSRAHCQRLSGGRRWRVYRRPLFPGYLFVRGNIADLWYWARIAMGIRKSSCPFLTMDGRVASIPTQKIRELRMLEHGINVTRSERLSFKVGDRVLVSDGAFTGHRATVHMLSDNERVQLLLDFLGQKSKVTLAADQIQVAA